LRYGDRHRSLDSDDRICLSVGWREVHVSGLSMVKHHFQCLLAGPCFCDDIFLGILILQHRRSKFLI
jgi:hypothetical protein